MSSPIDFFKPLLFGFIVFSPVVLLFKVKSKNNLIFQKKETGERISKKDYLSSFASCAVLALIIVSTRYVSDPSPQGFDTTHYVYLGEMILSKGIVGLVNPKLVPSLLAFLAVVLGKTPVVSAILMPYIFALAFSFIISLFAIRFTNSYWNRVALLSPIFLSFTFVRLSYDLFSQLLVISLFYLLVLEISERRIIEGALVAITMSLTNLHFAVIAFVFIAFWLPWNLKEFERLEGRRKKIRLTAGALAIIVLFLYFLPMVESWTELYEVILLEESSFFSPPKNWDWIIYNETIIIYILATFGSLFVAFSTISSKSRLERMILLWNPFLTLFIFITGYTRPYRFILFMSIPLLAGFGILWLRSIRHFSVRFKTRKIRISQNILPLALILFMTINVLPFGYRPTSVYFPADIIDMLKTVRGKYGFNNESIVLLVYPELMKQSYYWYYAFVGSSVYFGTPEDLQAELPDIHKNKINPTGKTVILYEGLSIYNVPYLMKTFSNTVEPSIYEFDIDAYLSFMSLASKQEIIEKLGNSVCFDEDFGSWKVWKGSVENDGVLNISLPRTSDETLVAGVTREPRLLSSDPPLIFNITSSSILLNYNLDGGGEVILSYELWRAGKMISDAKQTLSQTSMDKNVLIPFTEETTFDEIRIIVYNSGKQGKLVINLIAYMS